MVLRMKKGERAKKQERKGGVKEEKKDMKGRRERLVSLSIDGEREMGGAKEE